MKTYRLDLSCYAAKRAAAEERFRSDMTLCERPIKNLIDRYDLSGKSVLSIGGGDCIEEVWMSRAGCKVTVIDVSDCIGPHANEADGLDTFNVADATQFIANSTDTFDVIYASSFSPDELRRETIQGQFVKKSSDAQRSNYISWPKGTDPYHPILESSFRLLRPSGLVIFQHYRGGVDVVKNQHYFVDMSRQLARHGLQLIEAHHFTQSPQHLLVAAGKNSRHEIAERREFVARRPPLTTFHGRYPDDIKYQIERIEFTSPAPSRLHDLLQRLRFFGFLVIGMASDVEQVAPSTGIL